MTAPVDTVESMARELGVDGIEDHPSAEMIAHSLEWAIATADAFVDGRCVVEPGAGYWLWPSDWPHARLRALIARERAALEMKEPGR